MAAYYSPFGRAWELVAGLILAFAAKERPDIMLSGAKAADLKSAIGLAAIGAGFALVGPESCFPGAWALLPVLWTCVLISAGGQAWINRKFLSHPAMIWCGLISYPLYLCHWVFIGYARIAFDALRLSPQCASWHRSHLSTSRSCLSRNRCAGYA